MKPNLSMLSLGALLLAACGQSAQPTTGQPTTTGPTYQNAALLPALPVAGAYVPRQVIVGYRDAAALQKAADRAGAKVTLRLPELHAALLTLDALSVGQALYALQGQPGLAYAQPNRIRTQSKPKAQPVASLAAQAVRAQGIGVTPDPAAVPYFPQQWALKNTTPEGLNVVGAWDALKGAGIGAGSYTDGPATKPVILASFAEPLPPTADFKGQVVPALDFNAWLTCTLPNTDPAQKTLDPAAQNLKNGACTPPTTLTTADIQNIAANVQPDVNYNTADNSGGEASLDASNMVANGTGILGAAYSAKVMPNVVFGDGVGAFSGDLSYAVEIVWAVQHGATILNNSLGGAEASPIISAAANYALSQNALFVVSSGDNGDTLVSNPANVPGVVAVTSTGAGGNLSNDSQVNPYVRFGAPGDNIVVNGALDFTDCADPVACPQGVAPVSGYSYSGGTSSSAPYTAAVLALMQSAYHQKFGQFMTPGAAEDLLYSTATPAAAGTQAYTGFRIPNAQKAVQAVLALGGPAAVTRGAAVITVSGGSGTPLAQADVFLQDDHNTYAAKTGYGVGVPGTDPTTYTASPDVQDGTATFLNIAPGTYKVMVGGPEVTVDGDNYGTLNYADRLTATGTVTVTAGSTAVTSVQLPKTTFAVQTTLTSPRLHLAVAEPGGTGFVVAGRDTPTSGVFEGAPTLRSGERYVLGNTYKSGVYTIGVYTGDLAAGEQAFLQLTVTENGKTSSASVGPFTKGEASPASGAGSVANIVQLQPNISALQLK